MNVSEFLSKSYTCYHAVENALAILKKAGFAELSSVGKNKAAKGYYRADGGSLFAIKLGAENIQLALSHTDSPCLRLRYDGGTLLGVEKYGGGLLRSYFDVKLKIAGRVAVEKGGVLRAENVCSDFNAVIPSLAVHLGGGENGETFSVSRDMVPLLGDCGNLFAMLGVPDAVDGELFCVPAEAPFECGAGGEYICSPRIDNLASVYASVKALAECENKCTCVAACFNSEETGSETRDGARSQKLRAFIADTLKTAGIKADCDALLSRAFAFSCDGAHALHPNRPDKYSSGAPTLGGGVVIKRNDRYATDCLTSAAARKIFSDAGLKTQVYRHHPDLRCGSTIGLMAASGLGAAVCDIGVAQLAMHSAAETAAFSDIDALAAGLTAFFNREVIVSENEITVK